ncbi:DNA damage checkpoint control protein rad1 [Golovinomyces cichoracearum]|uniref:DNA damage checkpoint control protein rad1 n=1 Tax=Golovinomyces cichoracearum TaxID=62708 RepID=A0A420J211_9PEZI|nr:DNA damage checkpoint control protein rad1 [Golovinomyces cichoracearum]
MSAFRETSNDAPIFKSVSSSTKQLFQLLNCIRFAPKVHVQISEEGLRFAADEARVMQGIVFLDKTLFTTFFCNMPEFYLENDLQSSNPDLPTFQISLPALLETLQILGTTDHSFSRYSKSDHEYDANIRSGRTNAFSNQALGMNGVCRLSYQSTGSPLSIILEESNVMTTCHLTTYQAEYSEEIPFDRDSMQVKIIMQARWLFDALSELSTISSSRIDVTAYPTSPYFSLSAVGPLGSAGVDFSYGKDLLETFAVANKWTQSYKIDLLKTSIEAMKLASKVSIRGDEQGVLSLQFMVEVEGGGKNFIDFRFIPLIRNEEDDQTESGSSDREL